MKILECTKLQIGYNQPILRDLNFTIVNGDYVCVVGENGSGKSTLVKTLLHLVPPLAGKIRFDSSVTKTSIGYLAQYSEIKEDFPATVSQIVLSGCINRLGLRAFYSRKEKDLACRYMKLLEIYESRNKPLKYLSGGEQRRVLLARALTSTDKILFLDEPFNGLDSIVTSQLYEILERINKEFGVTIVMISHDIATALRHVNKVIHLDQAGLFAGTPEEYLMTEFGKNLVGGKHA